MAARQQPRGTSLEVQYKDFDPKFEWKDQPEATLFTVDLPGFKEEQIKVMYVHASSLKMIRVTGERPLAGRRSWSRFNKVFTVPKNCQGNEIHRSFNNNKLTITMRKETSKTVADKVEKRLLEESTRKEKEVEAVKKKKLLEEKEGILRKLREEAKAKEIAEERRVQEAAIAKEMAEERRLQEAAIAREMAEARRLQEEVQAKEMAEARKLQEGALDKEKVDAIKLQEEAKAKEKLEVRKLPELDHTNPGPGSGTRPVSGKASEAVKSAEEKLSDLMVKEKLTSEEKKELMVNVGVAALVVIFTIGAYVS